jgi:hypothetical protein
MIVIHMDDCLTLKQHDCSMINLSRFHVVNIVRASSRRQSSGQLSKKHEVTYDRTSSCDV